MAGQGGVRPPSPPPPPPPPHWPPPPPPLTPSDRLRLASDVKENGRPTKLRRASTKSGTAMESDEDTAAAAVLARVHSLLEGEIALMTPRQTGAGGV